MYEEYFGLNERPFSVPPDSSYLYLSKKHQQALSNLEYSILNKAFAVITGDIGSGKTTLIRELMRKLDENITVGLVSNVVNASFKELLQWILYAFELDYHEKGKVDLFEMFTDFLIKNYAENGRTVLIIDEAQNLGVEALEQLRTLSNINVDKHQVLQLILVGQPSLRGILLQPELLQLVQRIEVDYFLEPLDADETREYIQHRLEVAGGRKDLFAPDTYPMIWRSTGGVPRLINIVCDTALVYGFADQKKHIDVDTIKLVLKDKMKGLSPINTNKYSGLGSASDAQVVNVMRSNPQFDEKPEIQRQTSSGIVSYVSDEGFREESNAIAGKKDASSVGKMKPKKNKLSSIEKLFGKQRGDK